MTKYILDHASGKVCSLIYEGKKGISQRVVHVLSVDDQRICGLEDNQLKTFKRDRILAATWFNPYAESALKKNEIGYLAPGLLLDGAHCDMIFPGATRALHE